MNPQQPDADPKMSIGVDAADFFDLEIPFQDGDFDIFIEEDTLPSFPPLPAPTPLGIPPVVNANPPPAAAAPSPVPQQAPAWGLPPRQRQPAPQPEAFPDPQDPAVPALPVAEEVPVLEKRASARAGAAGFEYPGAPDYADALQNPKNCFQDPELQDSVPAKMPNGYLRTWVGGNAAVFKLSRKGKDVAVKAFTNRNDEREHRYRAISDHLRGLKCPHVVGFRYLPEGIRVSGRWLPLVCMDWVAGVPLTQWVGERLKRRQTDAVHQLAERWVNLMAELKGQRIAHGDLQHGNVLVLDNDELVLVDYDGMCVPALVGQPAMEDGLAAYQHPKRPGHPLGLALDDFSAWVIWLALRAVAAYPGLWQRHVVATENENLLFTASDLADPDRSQLWWDLQQSRDPEVARHAQVLRAVLDKPFSEVPPFTFDLTQDLVNACAAGARDWDRVLALADAVPDVPPEVRQEVARARALRDLRAVPTEPNEPNDRQLVRVWDENLLRDCPDAAVYRPHCVEADGRIQRLDALLAHLAVGPERDSPDEHYEQVVRLAECLPADYVHSGAASVRHARDWLAARDLLRQACQARRWNDVVTLSEDPALAGLPTPEGLGDRVREARQRVQALRRLDETLRQRSLRAAAKAYQPEFVDDWPAAAEHVRQARQARDLLPSLSELESATAHPGDGRELLRLWEQRKPTLPPGWQRAGWVELEAVRQEVERWRQRLEAYNALKALMAQPQTMPAEIVQAWRRLEELGGHPDAQALTQAIQLNERRARCVQALDALTAPPTEASDRLCLAAWDEEAMRGWPNGHDHRRRRDAAVERLGWLHDLDNVLAHGGTDTKVLGAADRLADGYWTEPGRRQKVAAARTRLRLRQRLAAALAATPASDLAIASAFDDLKQAKMTVLPGPKFDRCVLALRRRQALQALKGLAATLPADRQDQEWLHLWDEGDLEGCADVTAVERKRHHLARQRTDLWETLQQAMVRSAAADLQRLASHSLLADYPPFLLRRDEIAAVLALAVRVEAVCAQMDSWLEGNAEVLAPGDFDFMRDNKTLFEPHQALIETYVTRWLANGVKIRPGDPVSASHPGGGITVRWTWPDAGRVSYCLLAWEQDRFLTQPPKKTSSAEGVRYPILPANAERNEGSLERLATVHRPEHRLAQGGKFLTLPAGWRRVFVTVWPVVDLQWIKIIGQPVELGPITAGGRRRLQ